MLEKGQLFNTDMLGSIFPEDFFKLNHTLTQIIELFRAAFGDSTSSPWRRIDGLEILEKITIIMANLGHDLNKNDFRVYLETKAGKDAPEDSVTLNFWCFSAGVAMQTLMNKAQPHSLIITSGTFRIVFTFWIFRFSGGLKRQKTQKPSEFKPRAPLRPSRTLPRRPK